MRIGPVLGKTVNQAKDNERTQHGKNRSHRDQVESPGAQGTAAPMPQFYIRASHEGKASKRIDDFEKNIGARCGHHPHKDGRNMTDQSRKKGISPKGCISDIRHKIIGFVETSGRSLPESF